MRNAICALMICGLLVSNAAAQCPSKARAELAGHGARAGQDIVTTAKAAGSFKTLLAALEAADLADALRGSGPFTVFAPNDAAFAKLPDGTVATLLEPGNKDRLSAILTYHVVPGRVTAKDVATLATAKTLNGQAVDISTCDGGVTVDQAKVLQTDIACSNGVIHVIDSVIMPSTSDIVATANSTGSFNTLAKALQVAGLVPTLQGPGPFTVFAPTDEAFAKLPAGTLQSLLQPENRKQLQDILTYHVVPGRVYASDALAAGKAKTVEGSQVKIRIEKGRPMVNDAGIVATDIDAVNGVIHVIDTVILPG